MPRRDPPWCWRRVRRLRHCVILPHGQAPHSSTLHSFATGSRRHHAGSYLACRRPLVGGEVKQQGPQPEPAPEHNDAAHGCPCSCGVPWQRGAGQHTVCDMCNNYGSDDAADESENGDHQRIDAVMQASTPRVSVRPRVFADRPRVQQRACDLCMSARMPCASESRMCKGFVNQVKGGPDAHGPRRCT